jgi:hypothetical protein
MNIFIREIGRGRLSRSPDKEASKLVVEDNVGESIHVHIHNVRLEFTINDYLRFAECVKIAQEQLNNGNN